MNLKAQAKPDPAKRKGEDSSRESESTGERNGGKAAGGQGAQALCSGLALALASPLQGTAGILVFLSLIFQSWKP